MPLIEKKKLADTVFDNTGSKAKTVQQVLNWLAVHFKNESWVFTMNKSESFGINNPEAFLLAKVRLPQKINHFTKMSL